MDLFDEARDAIAEAQRGRDPVVVAELRDVERELVVLEVVRSSASSASS